MNIKRIPSFPEYYCTNEGIILDKLFRPVKTYQTNEPPFYPPWKVPKNPKKFCEYERVYLKRRSEKGKGTLKTVHTIVAKTWVNNPRPDIFNIVDHIDRNEHNNHPTNLRWVNRFINRQNNSCLNVTFIKRMHVKKGKKIKTLFCVNKWRSSVRINNKNHQLGMYKTFLEAYRVAKRFKEENLERNYKYLCDESPRVSQYLFLE